MSSGTFAKQDGAVFFGITLLAIATVIGFAFGYGFRGLDRAPVIVIGHDCGPVALGRTSR